MKRIKRVIFRSFVISMLPIMALSYIFRKVFYKSKRVKMGFLNIEFFHKDAGGFGGYGKCAKNITDHFNSDSNPLIVEMLLTRSSKRPEMKRLHNTDVISAPDPDSSNIIKAFRYANMLNARNIDFLITMEYGTGYQYPIFFLPKTPLLIWIHDPRPDEFLEKISSVSLELKVSGGTREKLKMHEQNIRNSISKVVRLSKLFNRKILFSFTANCLLDRAKKLYNLHNFNSIFLPTPVPMPEMQKISYSHKPSVCFLGRLDPIKRPWIFFELAKRFKNVDFFVAGKTHYPEVMDPIIKKYGSIANLKFLGLIGDEKKDEMLRNVWAIINTSIHEALPVSFLESCTYGKPIISCQNPDNIVGRYGKYTGEVFGDSFEGTPIDVFEEALNGVLTNRDDWMEKGDAARKFVAENYSFQKFEKMLKEITYQLGI